MTSKRDKYVIDCWLQLYNHLSETTFKVADYPGTDSSKQNVDAVCRDNAGRSSICLSHDFKEPAGSAAIAPVALPAH